MLLGTETVALQLSHVAISALSPNWRPLSPISSKPDTAQSWRWASWKSPQFDTSDSRLSEALGEDGSDRSERRLSERSPARAFTRFGCRLSMDSTGYPSLSGGAVPLPKMSW